MADVIGTGSYFNFSSMLMIRTSSHTCGRWYLPMFLLRDGLLTLMNIDSFINLERFCSSLPITEIIDVGIVTSDVTVVIDRGGGL